MLEVISLYWVLSSNNCGECGLGLGYHPYFLFLIPMCYVTYKCTGVSRTHINLRRQYRLTKHSPDKLGDPYAATNRTQEVMATTHGENPETDKPPLHSTDFLPADPHVSDESHPPSCSASLQAHAHQRAACFAILVCDLWRKPLVYRRKNLNKQNQILSR